MDKKSFKKFELYGLGGVAVLVVFISLVVYFNGLWSSNDSADTAVSTEATLTGSLIYSEGLVEISNEEDVWELADVGAFVAPGGLVRTSAGSRAIIEVGGSYVRLDSDTCIEFAEFGKNHVSLKLSEGNAYHRVGAGSSYVVEIVDAMTVEALGTAFETKAQEAEVYVWQSQVRVRFEQQTQDVQAGNRIRLEERNRLAVSAINNNNLSAFTLWNRERDQERGYGLGHLDDITVPELTLTRPIDDATTDSQVVAVKGTVEVGARVYLKVNNGSWSEINTSNGNFSTTATLSIGKNKVRVKAVDAVGNIKTIIRTATVTETAADNGGNGDGNGGGGSEAYLRLSGATTACGIKLTWSTSGYNLYDGFKILKDKYGHTPTYPDDIAKYLSDTDYRSYNLSINDGNKYNFRVCIYRSGKGCIVHSNTISVTAPTCGDGGNGGNGGDGEEPSIDLSVTALGGGEVKLTWTTYGNAAPYGYFVAWDTSPNPGYPTPNESYTRLTCGSMSVYTRGGFPAGVTYHFRICGYDENYQCATYSNNASVLVQ